MYSPDQTKALQQLTTGLMEKNSQGHITDKDIETLREVLRFHEHRYYILNDPLIADFEYMTSCNLQIQCQARNEPRMSFTA